MRNRGISRSSIIAVVIIGILGVIFYFAWQPAIGNPSESRRLVHPSGFSIVAPEGWEHAMKQADRDGVDSIRCVPHDVIGFGSMFSITRLPAPPDSAGLLAKNYRPVQFKDKAYEVIFDRGRTKQHTRSVVFEDQKQWFELLITCPKQNPVTGNPWQAYFDAVRVQPQPTTQSAVQ